MPGSLFLTPSDSFSTIYNFQKKNAISRRWLTGKIGTAKWGGFWERVLFGIPTDRLKTDDGLESGVFKPRTNIYTAHGQLAPGFSGRHTSKRQMRNRNKKGKL